jgi:acetolactate decarboxylase
MRYVIFILTITALAAQTPESLWRAARSGQRDPVVRALQMLQVSTLDALSSGIYSATYTVGELKRQGDFGVGTFEGLDGELIAIDGHFYQMRSNGQLTEADDKDKVPFVNLVQFKADVQFSVRSLTQTQLADVIDSLIPSKNHFYAIKVHGTFRDITTRAIAKQVLPYPPLAELIPGQSVFNYANIVGTAVGIRSPSFVAGLNPVGHHFHFVSDDRKAGGHSLAFTIGDATLEIQRFIRHSIWLPDEEPFRRAILPLP